MAERMTMEHIKLLLEDDYDPINGHLEIIARFYTGGPLELIIKMHHPVELSREITVENYNPSQRELDLLYGGYAPRKVELEQIVAGLLGSHSGVREVAEIARELTAFFEALEKSRLSPKLLEHISRALS